MDGALHSIDTVTHQRFPHAWFWPIAITSLIGTMGVFIHIDPNLSPQERETMLAGALVWRLIDFVLLGVFTYQLWQRIQDDETKITPGKAAGFLCIPGFNLYWTFRVWAGYATGVNAFCDRHDLPQRASQRVTMSFTVVWLLGRLLDWTPVGPVLALASWVLELVFVAHTGKLMSTLEEPSRLELKQCPLCAEYVKAAAQLCRYCRHSFVAAEEEQSYEAADLPEGATLSAAEVATEPNGQMRAGDRHSF